MDLPKRLKLPHTIPNWVDPWQSTFFITINCSLRGSNSLCHPEVARKIFETVRYRQLTQLWWPHLFLLMPDHVHALISFRGMDQSIQQIVSKWKGWTSKKCGIIWQRDFFEHRLRREESQREKADYILNNPVRGGLVQNPNEWLYVYFPDRPNRLIDGVLGGIAPVLEKL